MKRILYLFTFISCFLFSCTQDAYEKGEGGYSLLRGDFGEAIVNNSKQIASISTDDGEHLPLKEPRSVKWVTTADTTYRCILYYNKVNDASGRPQAEVVSIGQVPCPGIHPLSKLERGLKTDPVKFESIWMSRTGKYLNMSLQLMTGSTDDTTAVQKLAIVSDTLMTHSNDIRTLHVSLHHDQGSVPEYYSTQAYISLLVDSIQADSIRFTINTYNGPVIKTVSLRK